MRLDFSPQEETFRREAATWLEGQLSGPFADLRTGRAHDISAPERRKEWERALGRARWSAIGWPEEYGGRNATLAEQVIFAEEYARARAPGRLGHLGIELCGPTILALGTEAQKRRFLPKMSAGEEYWCQGYSEPNAGSDLSNVRTRARLEKGPNGPEWVIEGQKTWTSLAQFADWCFLVTRTEEGSTGARGLSYLLVPMHQKGVTIRPIRQMTGEAEFNEVYFTDARVPDAEMLGKPGDGWRVSLTTLMNERVSIGGAIPLKGSGSIASLIKAWGDLPAERRSPVDRDDVAKLWIRAEILRLTNIRASQMRKVGDPGPEGSIGKLASAELNKDIFDKALTLLGAEGMLYGSYEMKRPDRALDMSTIPKAFLRMRANSIEGGTTEVMKNILGERVLGLPGDVRVDRDVPWSQVPRN